jgi:VWFA-related protein
MVTFNQQVREARDGRPIQKGPRAQEWTRSYALKAVVKPRCRQAICWSDRRSVGAPRKILLLISDGGDNASDATLAQVLERARRDNVAIHGGLFDAIASDQNPKVLQELARETGGARFLPASPGDLLAICQRIAHEIRTGYTIAFVPPARDGRYHRLRVDVKGDGRLAVRTRPGYLSTSASASRAPQ